MESEKMNRKRSYSRMVIRQALLDILKTTPLSKVTVTDICKRADVNRTTFYANYEDIYDLLRWTFEKEALELLQQQQGVSPWQNGFLHLFQYINQNRAVCLCALDSLGKESLKRLLEADVSSIVDRAVRQTAVENGLPAHSPEVEVVICLVTIMMAGAVESWLRGELTQTPEELTRRIDMMFQDYIRGVALRLKAPAAVYA